MWGGGAVQILLSCLWYVYGIVAKQLRLREIVCADPASEVVLKHTTRQYFQNKGKLKLRKVHSTVFYVNFY
jgi:hypothetical protein